MSWKITLQFLAITFSIMVFGWGTLLICAGLGLVIDSSPWLFVPFVLGGLSPAIASYMVLIRNGQIAGFRHWLKVVFQARVRPVYYVFTVALVALFYVTQVPFAENLEVKAPYLFFAALPVVLIGGGMEEAGWRWVLQPQLEQKFGFTLSAILTAAIWSVWHLPLFYIPGVTQYGSDFGVFSVAVLAMSFSFGAIRRISGSVFLAVFAHTLTNAGFEVFAFQFSWNSTIPMAISVVAVSTIAVLLHERRASDRKPLPRRDAP